MKNNEWSRDKFPDEALKAVVIRMLSVTGIKYTLERINRQLGDTEECIVSDLEDRMMESNRESKSKSRR